MASAFKRLCCLPPRAPNDNALDNDNDDDDGGNNIDAGAAADDLQPPPSRNGGTDDEGGHRLRGECIVIRLEANRLELAENAQRILERAVATLRAPWRGEESSAVQCFIMELRDH